jgi:hypothetical protein
MEQLGIRPNRNFRLTLGASTHDVKYVFYPFLVPPGTWIGYCHPDGYFVVTVSWLFKSSDESVPDAGLNSLIEAEQLAVGSQLTLRRPQD